MTDVSLQGAERAAPRARPDLRGLIIWAARLSGLTIAGQLSFLVALPLLSRLYPPTALGLFTLYLSIVNIGGPMVGLKFEAALFGTSGQNDRRAILRLSVITIAANSLLLALILPHLAPHLIGNVGSGALASLWLLLPFGFFFSGTWSLSTAWAIKENDLATLSIARFVQPAAMTALQIAFGLLHMPMVSLVVAHLLSHVAYTGLIFARSLSPADRRAIGSIRLGDLAERARQNRHFPLFTMPAFLMTVLITNAPPLLMGAFFGADFAGQYGVAYRVVTGPLVMICLPLGNLLTSEISQASASSRASAATRFVLCTTLFVVVPPLLLFAFLAPTFCAWLLGPQWKAAGEIMAALAIAGAAQAVAAPFTEVTSICHRQKVRLAVDSLQLVLFFLPMAYGYHAGWDPITIVRAMALGSACGYLVSALTSLSILRAASSRGDAKAST